MSITKRVVASMLALSFIGGPVLASDSLNEITVKQGPLAPGGTAGFTDATFNQQIDGGNLMEVDVQGAIDTVHINQTGMHNELYMDVSALDTSTGSYVIDYNGDENYHELVVNTRVQAADGFRFADPNYTLNVTGSGNSLSEEFRGGGDFAYNGSFLGDDNIVDIRRGNGGVGNWSADYAIDGNRNTLFVDVGNEMNASRTFDINITGNENAVIYDIDRTGSPGGVADNTFVATYDGDNIDSLVIQSGALAQAYVTLVKSGPGAFVHTVNQEGDNSLATMVINANGAGSFSLDQLSAASTFDGAMTVETNGSVSVTQ